MSDNQNVGPEGTVTIVDSEGDTVTVTEDAAVTPVVETVVEPVVEVADDSEDEIDEKAPIILDQAAVDKIIGRERRKNREAMAAMQKELEDLKKKDYSSQLDRLAVGGIKRELLEKTGLKGDDLEDFAKNLAELVSSNSGGGPKSIRFESAMSGAPEHGVSISNGNKPASVEEAMSAIENQIKRSII